MGCNTTQTTSGKKLDEVAILRSFAVISVVLYHASWAPYSSPSAEPYIPAVPLESFYDSLLHNWLGARMPFFVFISGYLFSYLLNERGKYASIPQFVKKKFDRLIIPYVVFSLLIGVTLGSLTLKGLLAGYAHLWFILMLFWCFLITRMLAIVKNPNWQFVILVVVSFAGLIPATRYFALEFLIRCYSFFYLGYIVFLNKERLKWLFEVRFIIMLFAIWFSSCLYIQSTSDKFSVAQRHDVLPLLYTYFSYISFVLMLYSSTCKLLTAGIIKMKPWVDKLNRYSYGIYVFHLWFISLFFLKTNLLVSGTFFHSFVVNHYILSPLLLFTVSFFLSLFVTKLLLKTSVGRFLIG